VDFGVGLVNEKVEAASRRLYSPEPHEKKAAGRRFHFRQKALMHKPEAYATKQKSLPKQCSDRLR
jgi:hypothetical protein